MSPPYAMGEGPPQMTGCRPRVATEETANEKENRRPAQGVTADKKEIRQEAEVVTTTNKRAVTVRQQE